MIDRSDLPSELYQSNKNYILLTGATGLLGRYLLRDLLVRKERVAVIARRSANQSARQRVEAIMQQWERELGQKLPRPVVIEGDICSPDLGMSLANKRWVSENCRDIIHNAAILRFESADRTDEPFRTNYHGTANVLDFANNSGIEKFHYVSTAYVCGKASETVTEDQLDVGQELRNDYERSKFDAEKLVRAAKGFRNVTVFRPAVIIGDSKTGYTSTYHGLFLYLRLISMLVPQQQRDETGKHLTPIRLPMSGDEPRNLVTVDWVSSVIAHIVNTPDAHGETFHLTPETCTTASEVIDSCCSYFNSDGVVYAGADAATEENDEFSKTFFENSRIYDSYITSDPDFDRSNVEKWAGHLPCPTIDQAMIHRFIEFGAANRWGKNKAETPDVEYWFEDELERIGELAKSMVGQRASSIDASISIGLDIIGPGGGQWTLEEIGKSIRFTATQGLPHGENPVLTIDGKLLAQLLDEVSNEVEFGQFVDQFESTFSSAMLNR